MSAPRSLTRFAAKILVRAAEGMLDPAAFAAATTASERDIFAETVAGQGFDPRTASRIIHDAAFEAEQAAIAEHLRVLAGRGEAKS